MVAYKSDGRLVHARFRDLPGFLRPGDLLVINTSGTLPAALPAIAPGGLRLRLHLSTPLPTGRWLVELRMPSGPSSEAFGDGRAGWALALPEGGSARLIRPFGAEATCHVPIARLWEAEVRAPGDLPAYLARHGRPIRYGYAAREWPISAYQTVYATVPGSAEMPSAGRAFTPELLTALVANGVTVAPLLLHTGVSSLEDGERPYPEWYRVPASTAWLVNATREWGGRVIAVGTTVVRALETAAGEGDRVEPREAWTHLMVTPETGVQTVDGLLTGWHRPEASHLLLLEAVAGRALLEASYREALAHRYLWHEFGDLHLILP
jgi:S-adenosylmethionine:tRNA ribosyltransferase-isomerase